MANNFFDQLFGAAPEIKAGPDAVVTVNKNRCPENHPCPSVRVCPVNALSQKGYSAPVADMDKCVKCGKCVRYCPMGAISLH